MANKDDYVLRSELKELSPLEVEAVVRRLNEERKSLHGPMEKVLRIRYAEELLREYSARNN